MSGLKRLRGAGEAVEQAAEQAAHAAADRARAAEQDELARGELAGRSGRGSRAVRASAGGVGVAWGGAGASPAASTKAMKR